MKTIPLNNSDQVAIVDDEFYEALVAMGPWSLSRGGYVYCRRPQSGTRLMHRVVLQLAGFDLTNLTGDHGPGGKLDNRRENLKRATAWQNAVKQPMTKANTSGFRGVHWIKGKRKWRAAINVNGRRQSLGYFDDPIEAARAYDKAARHAWGDLAFQNLAG